MSDTLEEIKTAFWEVGKYIAVGAAGVGVFLLGVIAFVEPGPALKTEREQQAALVSLKDRSFPYAPSKAEVAKILEQPKLTSWQKVRRFAVQFRDVTISALVMAVIGSAIAGIRAAIKPSHGEQP